MAVSAVYFYPKHSALLVRTLIQTTPHTWAIHWRSLDLRCRPQPAFQVIPTICSDCCCGPPPQPDLRGV